MFGDHLELYRSTVVVNATFLIVGLEQGRIEVLRIELERLLVAASGSPTDASGRPNPM
jgi:hypothetical protein